MPYIKRQFGYTVVENMNDYIPYKQCVWLLICALI